MKIIQANGRERMIHATVGLKKAVEMAAITRANDTRPNIQELLKSYWLRLAA
jgi:ribosomal protein L15E